MKKRRYHSEELDSFGEVRKEMQNLRDEAVADNERVDKDKDTLASIIGDVCNDTLERFEAVNKRLDALESPPKKKPPKKKPAKKKK